MDQQQRANLIATIRCLAIAFAVAIGVGAVGGAINGWAIGEYDEYIIEKRQQYDDANTTLKRYARYNTLQFMLPLAISGFVAMVLVSRIANVEGYIALLPIAAGAGAGWLVGQLVGGAVGEQWAEVESALVLPAILFVVVPTIKIVKDY